jgi:hypothetical protein
MKLAGIADALRTFISRHQQQHSMNFSASDELSDNTSLTCMCMLLLDLSTF